jgi:hypothetical protein
LKNVRKNIVVFSSIFLHRGTELSILLKEKNCFQHYKKLKIISKVIIKQVKKTEINQKINFIIEK